jgi:dCMP deaminase
MIDREDGWTSWQDRWMSLATFIGAWSNDRNRGVGCVIVGDANLLLSIGYNGFPRGVDEMRGSRHDRPAKYLWTEHAERNAIYNAARVGVSTAGAEMYLPWYPCADCARAIVQSGIQRLICLEPVERDSTWDEHFEVSTVMLAEGGVTVTWGRVLG